MSKKSTLEQVQDIVFKDVPNLGLENSVKIMQYCVALTKSINAFIATLPEKGSKVPKKRKRRSNKA